MEPIPTSPSDVPALTPSRKELASAARRLSEDLSLIRLLAQKSAYGDGLAPEIRTVLAESCLERVVRLVAFFYPEVKAGEGLRADHFAADPVAWRKVRPPMPGILKSHLTDMTRLVRADRWMVSDCRKAFGCWPLSSFATELDGLMRDLEGQMSSEVAGWFRGPREVH